MGDLARLETLIDFLRPIVGSSDVSPSTAVVWYGMEVLYFIYIASTERAFAAVASGMKRAHDSGVHIFDFMLLSHGAHAALTSDNVAVAACYLEKIAPQLVDGTRPFTASFYNYLRSMEALISGDLPSALDLGRRALQLAEEIGAPFSQALAHHGLAQVYLGRREYADAESHLAHARRIGRDMRSALIEYMCLLESARSAFEQGYETSGIESLRKAMSLGKQQGYLSHPRWHSPVMSRLCLKALEEGLEVEYVQNLIRRRDLFPESPPLEMDNWPWGMKVHTLGRFELVKDGELLSFHGKAQKKPLDMLKILISLGGKDVTEDILTDSLWPEADGDAAHSAFSTTLLRLRQLIGHDKAIRLTEGKVSLAPRYCYLDTWAFERFLTDADNAFKAKKNEEASRLAEKGLALYEGQFLPGDTTSSWAISMRERLRSRFIRSIGRLGAYWEGVGSWDKAIECYQRALEVDGLAEEFYQRLMVCYGKQRRYAEALAVLDRCRSTLLNVLGVELCPKTEAIYNSLRHTDDRAETTTGS
jgi:DNA-binding SARP family transcriptional activator